MMRTSLTKGAGLYSYRRSTLLVAALSFLTLSSAAKSEPLDTAPQVDHVRSVAVTLSLIHLPFPIVEFTTEISLSSQFGLAATVGAGAIFSNAAFDVGISGRYYVIGDFDHGMQLGVEANYFSVDVGDGNSEVLDFFLGLGVGPFVGYKVSADVGFTFETQLGVVYYVRGNDHFTNEFFPLINVNLGWAF
jgi:hypothetical protein